MISLVLRARCAADLFSKKRNLPHPLPRFNGSVRGYHLAHYLDISAHLDFWDLFTANEILSDFDSEESDLLRPTFWLSKSEPVKEALYFADLNFLWKGLNARL